jgi:hypothetical protein
MEETLLCPNCNQRFSGIHDPEYGGMRCEHCEAAIFTCSRSGCLVTEDEWLEQYSMCRNCWDATIGGADVPLT